MKRLYPLISAAALMGLTAATAAPAMAASQPTVVYVSTTGSNTNNGSSTAPYATISYAVSQVATNGTVMVEPGTYDGHVRVQRDVTIKADPAVGGSAANTVLDAKGHSNGIVIAHASASGTHVTGLTVEKATNHGVFVQNSDNVVLSHLVVTENGLNPNTAIPEDKAIELVGTAHGEVYDNVVTDNAGGIGLADNGVINPGRPISASAPAAHRPAPSIHNVILDNTVSGSQSECGIVVASYNQGEGVIDNIVKGNTVSTSAAGIVVAADLPNTVARGNHVIDNMATRNFIPGIILHSNQAGDIVTHNSVIDNTVSGNGPDPDVTADAKSPTGIIAIGAVNPVTHSVIAGNTVMNQTYGIYLDNAPGTHGLRSNSFGPNVTTPVQR